MTTQELATTNYNINKAIHDPNEEWKDWYDTSFFGKGGKALKFDGTDDYATSTTKTITGIYSVHFWLYFNKKGEIVFGSAGGYLLYVTNSLWYWQNYSPTERFTYTAPLETWLAVTISKNSSNVCTLYVNGAEIDTCTRSNYFYFNQISNHPSYRFSGILDEFYIYDGVEANLADNQAFWNNGNGIDLRTRAGFETPDRYYSFNEDDGATIVTDAGSDGTNLTLTNFSTPPAYFIPH